MTRRDDPIRYPVLEAIILLFAVVLSRGLWTGWRDAPYDRLAWLAFLIWFAPLIVLWARERQSWRRHGDPWMLAAAMALLVLGVLADINAISYGGLACAIVALVPWMPWWRRLLWLGVSVCWMPAFGYFLNILPIPVVLVLRQVLAIAGAMCILWRRGVPMRKAET